jgi:hypothetical protein
MPKRKLTVEEEAACTVVVSSGAQGLASIVEWKHACSAKSVNAADGLPLYNLKNELAEHLVKALDGEPPIAVILRGMKRADPDIRLVFETTECLAETIALAEAHTSLNVSVSAKQKRDAKKEALGPRMRQCKTTGCKTTEDWALRDTCPKKSKFYMNKSNVCRDCLGVATKAIWAKSREHSHQLIRITTPMEGFMEIIAYAKTRSEPILSDDGDAFFNLRRTILRLKRYYAEGERACVIFPRHHLCLEFINDACRQATTRLVREHHATYWNMYMSDAIRKAEYTGVTKKRRAERSDSARKARNRQVGVARAALAQERREHGVKKCRGWSCCNKILLLECFVYAPQEAGVDAHRDAMEPREQPVCRDCYQHHWAKMHEYMAARPDRIDELRVQCREYENRQDIRDMRAAWRLAHPDPMAPYMQTYLNEDSECACSAWILDYRLTEPYKEYRHRWQTLINNKLLMYKHECARSGKRWYISDDEAIAMFTYPECFYCGQQNNARDCDGTGDMLCGIDRVDSTRHYTVDNSIPCCAQCNYSKCIHSADEFVRLCMNVTSFQTCGLVSDDPVQHYMTYEQKADGRPSEGCTFSSYISTAARHNRMFELTEAEFTGMTSMACHYCGTIGKFSIGVDRIDSSIGYVLPNCIGACTTCNMAKKAYTKSAFLGMCASVASRHRTRQISALQCPPVQQPDRLELDYESDSDVWQSDDADDTDNE